RSRSRAACREGGEAIGATVPHACAGFTGCVARHRRGYDRRVSQTTTIRVPPWIELVCLPVLLLVAFLLARQVGHVLFLFLTSAVIAFTLNPLVRDLTR